VEVFYAEAQMVFESMQKKFDIRSIFSYQESGTQESWNRDKLIKSFCKTNQIDWQESQRDGILRGIKNRKNWSKQ
jgi:deoxyribodipyrimidine photo-lyase